MIETRQRGRSPRGRLTYANVLSTIAVFIALGGSSYAAIQVTGQDVKNSSLTGKDIKDSSLRSADVKEGSLLAGDFKAGQIPAGPKGAKGDACLSIDPSCRGPQGNPGTNGSPGTNGTNGSPGTNGTNGTNGVDGAPGPPGAPGPDATYLNVNLANSTSEDVVVGTFALRFNCFGASPNFRQFILGVKGTGGAQLAGVKGIDDQPNNALPFSAGTTIAPESFSTIAVIGVNSPNPGATFPHYYRLGGTLVLHNGLRSLTVVFDMFLDDRNNTGTCAFRGSAVRSGLL